MWVITERYGGRSYKTDVDALNWLQLVFKKRFWLSFELCSCGEYVPTIVDSQSRLAAILEPHDKHETW